MRGVTKNLNKSASKIVINGKNYTKPAQLIDDLANRKISYNDFNNGFKQMFNLPANTALHSDAYDFLAHNFAKNNNFATAYYNGHNGIMELTTAASAEASKVATTSAKLTCLKSAIYEIGLRAVQRASYNTFDKPSAVINTGAAA